VKGHERAARLFCSIGPGRIQCGVEVTGAANTRQYAQWAAHARRYKGTRTTKLCRSDRLISSPDKRPTTSAAQATKMGSANWSGMVAAQTASVAANRPFKLGELDYPASNA